VTPFVCADRKVDVLEEMLVARRFVAAGSLVVFINVSADATRTDANFLHVRRVRGAP
jgi:hypothetical protein